jgi:hypothetical protein
MVDVVKIYFIWLITGLCAFGFIQDDEKHIKKLVADLGSSDFDTREKATSELINIGSKAIKFLKQATKSKELEIRWRAEKILRIIPVKENLPVRLWKEAPDVVDRIADDNFNVRIKVLGEIIGIDQRDQNSKSFIARENEIESILREVIRGKIPAKEKKQAVAMLGESKVIKEMGHILVKLLTDEKERIIRNGASEALGKMKSIKLAGYVEKLLAHRNPSIRAVSARTLGIMQANESSPKLVKLLEDKSHSVRKSAIKALTQLEGEKHEKEIIRFLVKSNPNIRCDALDAISELKIKEAIDDVIKRLEDEKPRVREKAIGTLVLLEAKDARGAIRKLLKKEKVESVRRRAEYALEILNW